MWRVSTEVGTVLLGQERGRPWPPGVATILCYSALGVLVQEVVLAELTGAILKQYLVTESIPELPKVVLNLAVLITTHCAQMNRAAAKGSCLSLPVSFPAHLQCGRRCHRSPQSMACLRARESGRLDAWGLSALPSRTCPMSEITMPLSTSACRAMPYLWVVTRPTPSSGRR